MSTAAVVAASRRKERKLVEHLREAGAFDVGSATPVQDQNWMGRKVISRLNAAGAIRASGGGFYLDEAAYAAYRSRRARNTALIMVPVVVAAILVIWWATTR
jgi:hypothetical protein